MSEDFNACVKAQLVTYLPDAFRKVLVKHEKIVAINDMSDMKLTVEEQKAAKAVIVHLEALIKLAQLILTDEVINDTSEESKRELLDIIQEAQERVNINRSHNEALHE